MKISLDGGVTYQEAPEGVRLIVDLDVVAGEDGGGELHLNATEEGLISDVWCRGGEHNIATSSVTYDELVTGMIDHDA